MQRTKAFVFAAEEDFGIAPVEAQACGAPVMAAAVGGGGALETVIESDDPTERTGIFFKHQTVGEIVDAVIRFEAEGPFDPEVCRRNAMRFGPERFRKEFFEFVKNSKNA